MARFSLTIDGMHCNSCVRRVSTALEQKGAEGLKVEVGSASGDFDPEDTRLDELTAAVNALGFSVTSVRSPG